MKLLMTYSLLSIGVVAVAAACSSSSSGGNASGGKDGGSSSSGGGSGSSSGSSSGSGSGSSSGTSSGGLPTITITTPTNGGTVTVVKQPVTGEVDAPFDFTTTNFTGKPAGGCGSVTNNCGHIHIFVDPSEDGGVSPCTPAGSPYNNACPLLEADGGISPFSPCNAIMSNCSNTDPINGSHTLRVELHSDMHAPIVGTDGGVIFDAIQFTAAGD
jgi:hypothetical protein